MLPNMCLFVLQKHRFLHAKRQVLPAEINAFLIKNKCFLGSKRYYL